MSTESHAAVIANLEIVLAKYGFEFVGADHEFQIVATNGTCVVLAWKSTERNAAERLNQLLSAIFYEKSLGRLTREMYVVILPTWDPLEREINEIEADTRICRKFVITQSEGTVEALSNKLFFLKPIGQGPALPAADVEIPRLFMAALTEGLDNNVADIVKLAIENSWDPQHLVAAFNKNSEQ
jgi:hypothetical protein